MLQNMLEKKLTKVKDKKNLVLTNFWNLKNFCQKRKGMDTLQSGYNAIISRLYIIR